MDKMRLTYKVIVRVAPAWLMRLNKRILLHDVYFHEPEDSPFYWVWLRDMVNNEIWKMKCDPEINMCSDIRAEICAGTGRTELRIIQNGETIMVFYIKRENR